MKQDSIQDQLKAKYSGYIIHFGNYDRNDSIRYSLKSNRPFSEALSIDMFKKGVREIFFITLDGKNIEWCCLAEKKRRVVTDKYKVEFKNFVRLAPSINIDNLKHELKKALKGHFIRSTSGNGGVITPKTWKSLLEIIEKNDPENFEKITGLFSKRFDQYVKTDKRGIGAYKKDASSFALNIGEIDPKNEDTVLNLSYGNQKRLSERNEDERLPPFLKGLEAPVLLEDQMIYHDCSVFDDWSELNSRPDVTAQFVQGNKIVTISNYNRHVIEEQTGVDMLYYNHHYDSYALIQYKRLDPNEKVFRPIDANYEKELKNMERLIDVAGLDNNNYSSPKEYRMNNMFCFFKLCEAKPINQNSRDLIKGMYFPLDLWKLLLDSDQTTGNRGGKRIGYDHVDGRYFNNTQFIDLFKHGWIGSSHVASKKITEIISEILENKHSLILASSNQRKSQHY